ncbi:hypothetical protein MTO96_019718 [Rhipicephalus appendiculatus]
MMHNRSGHRSVDSVNGRGRWCVGGHLSDGVRHAGVSTLVAHHPGCLGNGGSMVDGGGHGRSHYNGCSDAACDGQEDAGIELKQLILVIATAGTAFASHVPVAAVASTYHHAVVAAPTYVAAAVPAVSTTVHHTPAVSQATRVTSYQTTQPGVPHTVAKVSTYTPAATAVHTVHASVPHCCGRCRPSCSCLHCFLLVALATLAYGDSVATIGVPVAHAPYVAPVVSTAVHHAPTVSEASHVTSYETVHPGVPHTVARVSSYTPTTAAVHTVHASIPAAVTGAVHVPGYTYLPRYSHRYDPQPIRYTYGATPYGVTYGQKLGTIGYVPY